MLLKASLSTVVSRYTLQQPLHCFEDYFKTYQDWTYGNFADANSVSKPCASWGHGDHHVAAAESNRGCEGTQSSKHAQKTLRILWKLAPAVERREQLALVYTIYGQAVAKNTLGWTSNGLEATLQALEHNHGCVRYRFECMAVPLCILRRYHCCCDGQLYAELGGAAQADVQETRASLASQHIYVSFTFAFGPPCRPFQANSPMLSIG